jgi:hypothetical protein
MISRAHNMGFLTTPYAFNPEEAAAMAKVGAHIIVAHMGLTTAGSIGAKTAVALDDSAVRVQAIADAALRINPDIIVLCHGGTLTIFWRPLAIYCSWCSFVMLFVVQITNSHARFLRSNFWPTRSRVHLKEY